MVDEGITYCPHCGEELLDKGYYCTHCGGELVPPSERDESDFSNGSPAANINNNSTVTASQSTDDGSGTVTTEQPTPSQQQPQQATATDQQSKWPSDRLAVLGGLAIVALGAFLPWITASYLGTTFSASGITRDGVLTLGVAILVAIVVVVTWGRAAKICALVAGLGVLALASAYISDPFLFSDPPSDLARNVVSAGIGLYLTAFGGLIVAAGGGYGLVE
jgi:hypothetical protein